MGALDDLLNLAKTGYFEKKNINSNISTVVSSVIADNSSDFIKMM